MSTKPQVIWDTSPAHQQVKWDVEPPSQPITSTIGPDKRGTLQKINDWWIRPSSAYEGTLDSPGQSPRQKAQELLGGAAFAATPFLGAGLAASPFAASLGLAGGVAGGMAGGYLGKKAGEMVGAPELGEDIGGVGGGALGGVAGVRMPSAVSRLAYTGGDLSPLAKSVFHPTQIPEQIFRSAFAPPEPPPTYPGASLPSADEFYSNEAATRMKLNAQQSILDRRAAAAARMAAKNAPKPSPFPAGSVSTTSPVGAGAGELPAVPTGNPTPFPQVEKAGTVATTPRIVSPTVGEPRFTGSEGRPATWTNQDVLRLAQQGNREAIQQAVRRGMQLPPGARYVMGDPDFSRTVYNPRESTTFTPEGEPIRNVENPTVKAPRARVQVPEAGATPRETINAATGEVSPFTPPGTMVPPESSASSASPIPPPGPRWTGDPGAMPGEPSLFLDGGPDTAKAAIVEVQNPSQPGRSIFEARLPNGELLGKFGTAKEAASQAEKAVPSIRDITGPNLTRNALMDSLRTRALSGDTLAQNQLDDMIAHPFEQHEGQDINQMKQQKTVSRAEAEANAKKRLEGRNKRFGREK